MEWCGAGKWSGDTSSVALIAAGSLGFYGKLSVECDTTNMDSVLLQLNGVLPPQHGHAGGGGGGDVDRIN